MWYDGETHSALSSAPYGDWYPRQSRGNRCSIHRSCTFAAVCAAAQVPDTPARALAEHGCRARCWAHSPCHRALDSPVRSLARAPLGCAPAKAGAPNPVSGPPQPRCLLQHHPLASAAAAGAPFRHAPRCAHLVPKRRKLTAARSRLQSIAHRTVTNRARSKRRSVGRPALCTGNVPTAPLAVRAPPARRHTAVPSSRRRRQPAAMNDAEVSRQITQVRAACRKPWPLAALRRPA